jgi:hypothetical protein
MNGCKLIDDTNMNGASEMLRHCRALLQYGRGTCVLSRIVPDNELYAADEPHRQGAH